MFQQLGVWVWLSGERSRRPFDAARPRESFCEKL
jgi:hypothetical protein